MYTFTLNFILLIFIPVYSLTCGLVAKCVFYQRKLSLASVFNTIFLIIVGQHSVAFFVVKLQSKNTVLLLFFIIIKSNAALSPQVHGNVSIILLVGRVFGLLSCGCVNGG